jgi:hypothetical protein
VASVL